MTEDYPKTLLEMEGRFATEDACREYLTKLRWPAGLFAQPVNARSDGRTGVIAGPAKIVGASPQ